MRSFRTFAGYSGGDGSDGLKGEMGEAGYAGVPGPQGNVLIPHFLSSDFRNNETEWITSNSLTIL